MNLSGERTVGSLYDVLAAFYVMGIPVNQHAVFLDIGSGRGLPNVVAALFAGKSLGIEHDRTRCQVLGCNCFDKQINSFSTYRFSWQCYYSPFLQQSLNLLSRLLVHKKRQDLHPKANTFFLEKDILKIKSLRGITHVYCFDCGFPQATIEHMVRLFNQWYVATF